VNATDTDQIVMTDKNTTPDTQPSPPTQKMPPQKTPRAAAELKLPWRGLGIWNVYFILKFALAYFSYLNLDVLWNALLLVFLLIPIPYRWLSALRGLAAIAAGLPVVAVPGEHRGLIVPQVAQPIGRKLAAAHCEPHNERSRGEGILAQLRH